MKTYEFVTSDPVEFQHWRIMLLAKGIQYRENIGREFDKDPLYHIMFDAEEYRLPFEFCNIVN